MPSSESFVQDIRFAIRMLSKAPGFTIVAVLILALGIGANSAVFSLVNGLLLRPLNDGRLSGEFVGLYSGDRTRPDRYRAFSYPEYVDIRRENDVFDSLIAEAAINPGLTEAGLTRRVRAGVVSSNYFSALGVDLAAGCAFTLDEERPDGAAAVAIVSYPYWQQRGLTPDILGRSITVNGHSLTIVGVAPPRFNGTMPRQGDQFMGRNAGSEALRGVRAHRWNVGYCRCLRTARVSCDTAETGDRDPDGPWRHASEHPRATASRRLMDGRDRTARRHSARGWIDSGASAV